MTTNHQRPACVRCGEPIGAYERIYADFGDGEPLCTGWLNLPSDRAPRALWHAVCGAPAATRAPAHGSAPPARRRRGAGGAPEPRAPQRLSL